MGPRDNLVLLLLDERDSAAAQSLCANRSGVQWPGRSRYRRRPRRAW
jgi:hypothetical protein